VLTFTMGKLMLADAGANEGLLSEMVRVSWVVA
jgi:hypothetical protein